MNTSLILTHLRQSSPISRAGLAAQTGLTKATVSNVVRDLITSEWVREAAETPSLPEIGRPAINLELNPNAGYILSLEIGVDFVALIVTNFAVEIVTRRYERTRDLDGQEAILERALVIVSEVIEQIRRRNRPIFGMSIAVPGLVDLGNGQLLFAPNLGWRNVPLRKIFEERFSLPVSVSNEANCAALGESYLADDEFSDFLVYVSSGVGLGGGLVINRELLTGSSGFSGEVGHMTVEPGGRLCNCGNRGCWETVASQSALFRRICGLVEQGRETILTDITHNHLDTMSVAQVVQAMHSDDALVRDALTETGKWLGIGIANLVNIISPQRVVFGGPLALAHPVLLPVIQQEVHQRAFPWLRDTVDITVARHVADAAVMGGIAMIHKDILRYPLRWIA